MATSSQVRVDSGSLVDPAPLIPPPLPPFLATAFDLRPIVGAPNNEEMKIIHAVIRALTGFLHSSELRDSALLNLSMDLSQHLFDAQLARHREKYPIGLFPNEITSNPPKLPAHIPVLLEPVVGSPSDEDLRSAHAAIRILGGFSNSATFFDANLEVELSQHLFDLQLARRAGRLTRTTPAARRSSERNHPPDTGTHDGVSIASQARDTAAEDTRSTITPNCSGPPATNRGELNLPHSGNQEAKNNSPNSSEVLVEIREALTSIYKAMISSQNSLAKGFNSGYRSIGAHSLLNSKGEVPEMHGLPTVHDRDRYSGVTTVGDLSPDKLARYLRFYDIGHELIEDGERLTVKSARIADAKKMLERRIYTHVP